MRESQNFIESYLHFAHKNGQRRKLHVAIFPGLAYGHIIPYLELSKFLAQKDHKVSFISTPKNISSPPKFLELPLPYIDGLPQTAESTSELWTHQVTNLKKAYDMLEPHLTQFLQNSD
ncbi:udp-glycosyltransferase 91c1, partial [Quercus suber]